MSNQTNWDVEAQNIEQRRKYAEALRAQSMEPISAGELPGVKISPFQGLAKIFDAYNAGKAERKADEDSKNLATSRNKALADALKQSREIEKGGPTLNSDGSTNMVMPERQPNPQGAADHLLASGHPVAQQLAISRMTADQSSKAATQKMQEEYLLKKKFETDPEVIAAKQRVSPKSDYFVPVQTAEGVMSFDSRRGVAAPLTVGGKHIVGSGSDPRLQADIAYGKKAGAEIGNVDVEQHESAISSLENIKKIDDLISHLKESDAITGMGSDFFKNIERAKVMVTNSQKAGKKVSDTEMLDTMMGSEVFPLIKSLGIGAKGMDTPAEREFMRSVLTGQTNLNKDTLIRMAEIRKDVANRAMKRWNDRVGTGELDKYFQVTGRPKGTIGPSNPPPGVQKPGAVLRFDAQGNQIP